MDRPYHILMVCMGNICRSPTAEVVLRAQLHRAGLADRVQVASAGTHGHWHAGEGSDPRSVRHAARRGYDLSAHRARALTDEDVRRFSLLLAMDWDNLGEMERRWPDAPAGRMRRLSEFARRFPAQDVIPDPYSAGPQAFEQVLDLVEDACEGVVLALPEQIVAGGKGTS
jgi:protein-tyrosine phosphatase